MYKWEAIEADGGKWHYDVEPIFTERGGWMPQSMNWKFIEQMPTRRNGVCVGWENSLRKLEP